MRNLFIIFAFIILGYMSASSQIIDVVQVESMVHVKTESGTNILSNIVNSSCQISGFNSRYFVVSCWGTRIYVYNPDGSTVANISNAIYPDDSNDPKYVSNVTENYIIVKSKKSNRKDYYDFNGNYVKNEN